MNKRYDAVMNRREAKVLTEFIKSYLKIKEGRAKAEVWYLSEHGIKSPLILDLPHTKSP